MEGKPSIGQHLVTRHVKASGGGAIWISEARPLQHFEIKLTAPSGVHDRKILIVVCFYADRCVILEQVNFFEDSVNISKQSMILVSIGNFDLKAGGIV